MHQLRQTGQSNGWHDPNTGMLGVLQEILIPPDEASWLLAETPSGVVGNHGDESMQMCHKDHRTIVYNDTNTVGEGTSCPLCEAKKEIHFVRLVMNQHENSINEMEKEHSDALREIEALKDEIQEKEEEVLKYLGRISNL